MLMPAQGRPSRQQVASTTSVPAPINGWNRRDSVAVMKPTDAILIKNWFPTASDIMVRRGSANHATGIPDRVETLATYRPTSGAHSLWAWAGGSLYNVTGAGPVGAAVVTGLTNAQWRHTNYATSGGRFLIALNGADNMLLYDGSTWKAITAASTPAITGVLTSTLISVNIFKRRPFYIQVGSMSAWYPASVDTFAGALTELPLGSVFKRGGYLMAMGTWTVDGGAGLDDFAVFITSQGEVAVYQGSNPGDANDWYLRGVYNIGAPIGRDCILKYGGDLLINTNDGVVPASKAFIDDRTSKAIAITDRIQGAMSEAAAAYKFNAGWSLTHYPAGSMLLLNVPIAPGQQEQYVMNTVTGAWCQFVSWPATCFEILNDELYFGTDNAVVHAWTGTDDRGALITSEVVPAFSYFGSRTQMKQFKMFRPIAAVDVNPLQIQAGVDVDYVIQPPTSTIDFPVVGGSLWDVAQWDVARWGGLPSVQPRWYTASGIGYCGAAHIRTVSNRSTIRLLAIEYLFEPAGVI